MQHSNHKNSGLFITGSDTAVGKTWVSCQIIHQLKDRLESLKVRKPVESGCRPLANEELFPADGHRLFEANNRRENLQLVTAYRYIAATSPDRAARLENKTIYLNQLQQAVNNNRQPEDFLLVEGAGGFYSPIAEDGLNADLARRLKLDVIIVIEDRLGAINQALMTIKAVESEGLTIKALILNQLNQDTAVDIDNLADLSARTAYPVYLCPFNGQLEELNLVAD